MFEFLYVVHELFEDSKFETVKDLLNVYTPLLDVS